MRALFAREALWLRILLFGLYLPSKIFAQTDPCFNSNEAFSIVSQTDADTIANCTTFTGDISIDATNDSIVLHGVGRVNGNLELQMWDFDLVQPTLTFQAPNLEYLAGALALDSNCFYNATFDSLTTIGALWIGGEDAMTPLQQISLPAGLGYWSDESYTDGDWEFVFQKQSISVSNTQLGTFPNLTFTTASTVEISENPFLTSIVLQLETSAETSADCLTQDCAVIFPQLKNISTPVSVNAAIFRAPNLEQIDSSLDLNISSPNLDLPNLTTISGSLTALANLTEADFPKLEFFEFLSLGATTELVLSSLFPSLKNGIELDFTSNENLTGCDLWAPLTTSGQIQKIWCNELYEEPVQQEETHHGLSTTHLIEAVVAPVVAVALAAAFIYKYRQTQRERRAAINTATEAQSGSSDRRHSESSQPGESNHEEESIELPKYTPGSRPPEYQVDEVSTPGSSEQI